ncbi:MAG: uridine kinase [bacterium]|nr:uridine kinase [bacterium]
MALTRDRDGKRIHVKSKLMGESLVSNSFLDELDYPEQKRLFPELNILKVGGQSICDRGKNALPPIIDEIAENNKKHKMLITTGGGTRSRHIYSIGIELGMPTGIIAKFGTTISDQNALLVSVLLAQHGGIKIGSDELVKLSQYLDFGSIPVIHGMPPYDLYALPPVKGRIPIHRTDVGTLILADLLGAKSVIFVKDENGLYTNDPKKEPNAEFIPEISVSELMERNLDDLVLERPCLEIMLNSQVIDRVQIINGMVKGNITKALNNEHVGTILHCS